MARCRSCDAEITWARTAAGRRMPLDLAPSPEGNVRLAPSGLANVLAGNALVAAREAREVLHLSHHATCPQGPAWRRS